MWEDAYEESRHEAALLLDLLGYFPGDRVENSYTCGFGIQGPKAEAFRWVSCFVLKAG